MLAAAADPAIGPIGALAQYGVLGIIVIVLFLFARQAYDREAKRADRLEEELAKLRDRTEERIIPLATRAIDVLERAYVEGGNRRRPSAGDPLPDPDGG